MKEMETRVTQKGQVTIPAEIRALLGLKPRDVVRFEVEGGEVKLTRADSVLLKGYGAVKPKEKPEDWRKVRSEVEKAIAEESAREGS